MNIHAIQKWHTYGMYTVHSTVYPNMLQAAHIMNETRMRNCRRTSLWRKMVVRTKRQNQNTTSLSAETLCMWSTRVTEQSARASQRIVRIRRRKADSQPASQTTLYAAATWQHMPENANDVELFERGAWSERRREAKGTEWRPPKIRVHRQKPNPPLPSVSSVLCRLLPFTGYTFAQHPHALYIYMLSKNSGYRPIASSPFKRHQRIKTEQVTHKRGPHSLFLKRVYYKHRTLASIRREYVTYSKVYTHHYKPSILPEEKRVRRACFYLDLSGFLFLSLSLVLKYLISNTKCCCCC